MAVQLRHLSPILWVKNLEETIAFYEDVLGFSSKTNFPGFASLSRDRVEIMVIIPIEEPQDCKDGTEQEEFFPKSRLTGSIFIYTQDVDALWQTMKDRATIKSAIDNREYLMRDFSILDNNGYELVFGQDIS